MSGGILNSSVKVSTNTPYLRPEFECNDIQYPVHPSVLGVFYSNFTSSAGQYDCKWNVSNTYKVTVSSGLLESSAVKPVITTAVQKNITDTYLENSSIDTFYINYIAFPNLANISWSYDYTYNSSLSPYPNFIDAYLSGKLNFTRQNTSGFTRSFTVPANTTDNYTLVYKWDNGTSIVIAPRENLSYNNTFGYGNNISEYVQSVITPLNEPNGTVLKINDSCDYLQAIVGKGPIKGVECGNYTLVLDYLHPVYNVSYSWIRENGTNVSYDNVTLTQDILNQSIKGYELYNITNLQNISITAGLNAAEYEPLGWNESTDSFTVSENTTRQVNISAVGQGTRISNYTQTDIPHPLSTTFFYKAVITIPNSTRAWVISNPAEYYSQTNRFEFFYRRSNATLTIAANTIKGYVNPSVTPLSIAPTSPVYTSIGISRGIMENLTNGSTILLTYSVNNNGLNPISSSVPLFVNVPISTTVSYVVVGVILITFVILFKKGIIKEMIKRIQEDEKK